MVQRIEDARPGQVGKSENGQGAQMRLAQHRPQPAGERCIDQQTVEIERRRRHGDRMTLRRYGAVQIAQRLAIIQRPDLGHEAGQQVEHPAGLVREPGQFLPPVALPPVPAGVQEGAFRLGLTIGGAACIIM